MIVIIIIIIYRGYSDLLSITSVYGTFSMHSMYRTVYIYIFMYREIVQYVQFVVSSMYSMYICT